MVFFPQVFPPKPCTRLFSPPSTLHAPPISFFSILSPAQYWVSSRDHEAHHYVFFSTPLLLSPYTINTSSETVSFPVELLQKKPRQHSNREPPNCTPPVTLFLSLQSYSHYKRLEPAMLIAIVMRRAIRNSLWAAEQTCCGGIWKQHQSELR
jgi:hypothetical protein